MMAAIPYADSDMMVWAVLSMLWLIDELVWAVLSMLWLIDEWMHK